MNSFFFARSFNVCRIPVIWWHLGRFWKKAVDVAGS